MKKLLILCHVLFILTSCHRPEQPEERFDRFLTELECPVVLIGKTDKAVNMPSVSVVDGKGRVRTFSDFYGLPQNISQSREVGDTLKKCQQLEWINNSLNSKHE